MWRKVMAKKAKFLQTQIVRAKGESQDGSIEEVCPTVEGGFQYRVRTDMVDQWFPEKNLEFVSDPQEAKAAKAAAKAADKLAAENGADLEAATQAVSDLTATNEKLVSTVAELSEKLTAANAEVEKLTVANKALVSKSASTKSAAPKAPVPKPGK